LISTALLNPVHEILPPPLPREENSEKEATSFPEQRLLSKPKGNTALYAWTSQKLDLKETLEFGKKKTVFGQFLYASKKLSGLISGKKNSFGLEIPVLRPERNGFGSEKLILKSFWYRLNRFWGGKTALGSKREKDLRVRIKPVFISGKK